MPQADLKTVTATDFLLSTGDVLPELTVAYETYGDLAPDGSNAILLCHGFSNDHFAGGDKGWASQLVGAGKAVDTDKYCVVSSNMLGSAFGTSGPGSLNPETGRPYGPDFPKYCTEDMVAAQHLLLERLGIGRLKAVMGYSYGGHLTYLWGATHPDRMDCLVSFAGMLRYPNTMDTVRSIRNQYAACAGWNGGHYYGHEMEPGGVYEALAASRKNSLKRAGFATYLTEVQGLTPAACDTELTRIAENWAMAFDANSMSLLNEAGVGSDVTPRVSYIKAPVLQAMSNSDCIVPISLGPEIDRILKDAGVTTDYKVIETDCGHVGPTRDASKWDETLRAFLEKHAAIA